MTNEETLQKVRKMYKHSVDSTQYTIWWDEATLWERFYEGDQWSEEELAALRERGQPDIVINLIAPKIDALSGTEIQTRTAVAFRPRSFDEQDVTMAEAFTAIGQQVQEHANIPTKQSSGFKDSLIYGIGWLELDSEGTTITAENVSPRDMFWDIDDETELLEDSAYVGKRKWLDADKAKLIFPNHASEIDQLIIDADTSVGDRGLVEDSTRTGVDEENHFVDVKHNKIRIIEIQYKKPSKVFRYADATGRIKEVFDRDEAEKNKLEGTTVEERVGDQIFSAMFSDDILLHHEPLETQSGNFTYVPMVHKRRRSDLVPMGVVAPAIDPQTEYNKRRSKLLHFLNTNQLVLTGDAHSDLAALAKQANLPNGVMHIQEGSTLDIKRNLDLAQGQFQIMTQAASELQQAMGIFDELLGQQTNATSGIAVTRRQQASVRTQGFAFDRLKDHKKKVGKVLLNLIQAVFTEQTVVSIMGESSNKGQQITLNETYLLDGKQVTKHDVNTVEFDVVVEESADFSAPPQEVAARLEQIVGNGQLELLMNFPAILKQMGVRDIEQITKEVQEFQAQQQQVQQQGQPAAPQGTPPPVVAP